jgi:hypothetical protein
MRYRLSRQVSHARPSLTQLLVVALAWDKLHLAERSLGRAQEDPAQLPSGLARWLVLAALTGGAATLLGWLLARQQTPGPAASADADVRRQSDQASGSTGCTRTGVRVIGLASSPAFVV